MDFISSRSNERIKNIVKLNCDKKERQKQGLFVLEGFKLLFEAKNNKIKITTILLTEKFFKDYNHKLKFILNDEIDIIIISQDVCKKISKNITPQEIFAICKMPEQISLDFVLKQHKNILMMLDLQDVGNFGTIIRTANAFGIDCILVSKNSPDIFDYKVLRSTMGSVFKTYILKIDDEIDVIRQLKNNGFLICGAAVLENCEDIRCVSFSDKNVIIVGNEGRGLEQDVIDSCDKLIKIPMDRMVDSLNVSVATGILLWMLKSKIG